jgi:preprotein translocase subunit SecA
MRTKRLLQMAGMKEGEVIESGMLTRQIEKAQRKVESHNFDIRKQLLLFDDVANDQRKVVYQQRTEIMGTEDLSGAIVGIMEESVGTIIDQHMPKTAAVSDWDLQGLGEAIQRDFNVSVDPKAWVAQEPELEEQALRDRMIRAVTDNYKARSARMPEVMRHVEKEVMLKMLDQHWREHLAAMDYLRQGIHLRGYAQKDYRFEYKREAFELFAALLDRVKFETVSLLAKIEIRSAEEVEREEEERRQRLMRALQAQHAEAQSVLNAEAAPEAPPPVVENTFGQMSGAVLAGVPGAMPGGGLRQPPPPLPDPQGTFVRGDRKVGRNELCPCGSGKKFKHCHGTLQSVE